MKNMELTGKVVVITGGGSGIGKATAKIFAEHGAKTILCGRHLSILNDTVREIEQKKGDAVAISVDITDQTQVIAMTDTILQRFRKIDILINNAGIIEVKPIVQMTEQEWDNIIDVNLKGVFLCCKALIPTMITANQGTIINVSSVLGKTGIANHSAYCASKFGVIGLTQALADELKENNIRVFAICPTSTNTALHRKAVGEEKAKLAMPPQTVAEVIFDLSLENSAASSGSAVVIDESIHLNTKNSYKDRILCGLKLIRHPKKMVRGILSILRK